MTTWTDVPTYRFFDGFEWHSLPSSDERPVEHSIAMDEEAQLIWRRTVDKTNGIITYAVCPLEPATWLDLVSSKEPE